MAQRLTQTFKAKTSARYGTLLVPYLADVLGRHMSIHQTLSFSILSAHVDA